jgi:Ca2+-binding RTX toxin-like protein
MYHEKQTGTAGTNGTPGTGQAGGPGQSRAFTYADPLDPLENYFSVEMTGGSGGNGGSGTSGNGSGHPGGDGGPGGSGGDGGSATAEIRHAGGTGSLVTQATGGDGGDGGYGGYAGNAIENNQEVYAQGGNAGSSGVGGGAWATIDGVADLSLPATGPAGGYDVLAFAAGGAGGGGASGGTGSPGYAFGQADGAGSAGARGGDAEALITGNTIDIAANSLRIYASADAGDGGIGATGDYYFLSTAGGNAGSASAEILSNVVTGSSGAEAISFELDGMRASGGIGGSGYGYDGRDRSAPSGASSITALKLDDNEVNLGAGDDKLTIRFSTYEGGALTFTGNTFGGGGGFDTLVLDGSLLDASGTRVSGITFDLTANTYTGFERVEGTTASDKIMASNDGMSIFGLAGQDALTGGTGSDFLDGGTGIDTLVGGDGNDRYAIDSLDDVITEAEDGGWDTVRSSVFEYMLGKNLENLILTGTAIRGIGNDGDNRLIGNSSDNGFYGRDGNDWLDGGTGSDSLTGGDGNDLYFVDDAGDVVNELVGLYTGLDEVRSTVTFSLTGVADGVEILTLQGTGAIDGTGNDLANTITGNDAANILDGGAGADAMRGRGGDDTYYVDHTGDRAIEVSASGGIDKVYSSVSFTMGNFIEKLTLEGTAIRGTGNGLANEIVGNAEANVLDGAAGADTLYGHGGNDTFVVDDAGDKAVEAEDEGTDTVFSTLASYTLGDNIENLRLKGTAVSGTGNELANDIRGTDGINQLDGGAGADKMRGGAGADTYFVDNAGDRVIEAADQGTDVVMSSVSYTLAGNVENLTLTGTASGGKGNDLANVLIGNALDNTFKAYGGDDEIHGRLGNDTLYGGDGADSFVFETALDAANNVDRLKDFSSADDTIVLDTAVFSAIAAGDLSEAAFVVGPRARSEDHRIIYEQGSGMIFYDADGSGEAAQAVLFAQVNAGTELTHLDFAAVTTVIG